MSILNKIIIIKKAVRAALTAEARALARAASGASQWHELDALAARACGADAVARAARQQARALWRAGGSPRECWRSRRLTLDDAVLDALADAYARL